MKTKRFKYINKHGKEVWLQESEAFHLHYQMKEFLGDENGHMILPGNLDKSVYKKGVLIEHGPRGGKQVNQENQDKEKVVLESKVEALEEKINQLIKLVNNGQTGSNGQSPTTPSQGITSKKLLPPRRDGEGGANPEQNNEQPIKPPVPGQHTSDGNNQRRHENKTASKERRDDQIPGQGKSRSLVREEVQN